MSSAWKSQLGSAFSTHRSGNSKIARSFRLIDPEISKRLAFFDSPGWKSAKGFVFFTLQVRKWQTALLFFTLQHWKPEKALVFSGFQFGNCEKSSLFRVSEVEIWKRARCFIVLRFGKREKACLFRISNLEIEKGLAVLAFLDLESPKELAILPSPELRGEKCTGFCFHRMVKRKKPRLFRISKSKIEKRLPIL